MSQQYTEFLSLNKTEISQLEDTILFQYVMPIVSCIIVFSLIVVICYVLKPLRIIVYESCCVQHRCCGDISTPSSPVGAVIFCGNNTGQCSTQFWKEPADLNHRANGSPSRLDEITAVIRKFTSEFGNNQKNCINKSRQFLPHLSTVDEEDLEVVS